MLDLLTRPRTRVQRGTAMLHKYSLRWPAVDGRQLLWEAYVTAYGDPTEPRPEWEFQGPGIAQMRLGPRLKRIPRELRRIYAPYP